MAVSSPFLLGPNEDPALLWIPHLTTTTKAAGKKGHFICVMATFSSSEGQYERLGKLLQRFVIPIEPNEQLLLNSDMYALKIYPACHNPQQWAISIIIFMELPVRAYTSRDGKGR